MYNQGDVARRKSENAVLSWVPAQVILSRNEVFGL